MPRYRTSYVKRNGSRRHSTIDAADLASLSDHLEKYHEAYIISITKIEREKGISPRIRISTKLLLAALDSLELMLLSGVRINVALGAVADNAPPGNSRSLWIEILRLVEENGSFADSIRRFPNIFTESIVGVISAHEKAGRLPVGIGHVRTYVSQMQDIKREAVRGMAYPALVCVAGFCSSLVLCLFTLPRFARMLKDIGVNRINRITGFFFGLSDFIVRHPVWTLSIIALPMVMIWFCSLRRFRPLIDFLITRLPLIRQASEALSMARICITYRTLSEAGIRVLETLDFCAAAAGNLVYSNALHRVIAAVRENASVGVGFEKAGIFAPEVVLAVKSGDGVLPQVFGRLGDYYSMESKHRIALALRMIEPAMLILVLAWVLCVSLAVVLPVVEIINEIH